MAKGVHNLSNMSREQKFFFWSKVKVSNIKKCWEWTGAKKPKGYGNVRIERKYMLAHRVAYMLFFGEVSPKMLVMHECDNPSCCNPWHLKIGTFKDNIYDMILKGRDGFKKNHPCGEKNYNSKLTDEKVREIRRRYAAGGIFQKDLGKEYGINQSGVGLIINRKAWRHVE